MSDRLLDRFVGRGEELDRGRHEPERDESEDFGSFGWLRGIRDRAPMLELRRKDGHCLALGYGWIERMEYEPEKGITLHLHGTTIRILGHGLNSDLGADRSRGIRLYEGLTRHRVTWVRECERTATLDRAEKLTFVERLDWT